MRSTRPVQPAPECVQVGDKVVAHRFTSERISNRNFKIGLIPDSKVCYLCANTCKKSIIIQREREASGGIWFLNCPSCRKDYPIESGLFSCPGNRAGEEHTLRRMLPPGSQAAEGIRKSWAQGSRRSFDRFHPLLSGCNLLGYGRYGRILDGMTDRLRRMEGRDFSVTPLTEAPGLASAIGRTGRLWVKNETGNVTGSHKGRHLMGTLLYLEALRELIGAGGEEGPGHLQLRQRRPGGRRGGPRRRLRTARFRPGRRRPDGGRHARGAGRGRGENPPLGDRSRRPLLPRFPEGVESKTAGFPLPAPATTTGPTSRAAPPWAGRW